MKTVTILQTTQFIHTENRTMALTGENKQTVRPIQGQKVFEHANPLDDKYRKSATSSITQCYCSCYHIY